MKVLIINYNRLTLPRKLADWCASHGLTPIFIDNHSDYFPLLEYYYSDCPYEIFRLKENYGYKVVSTLDLKKLFGITGRFIVTDPDLDLTGVPDDFLAVLNEGLDRYPKYRKCGLSLEINDLPNSPEGDYIRTHHEVQYWQHPLDSLYFDAFIDTTFALYREQYLYHSIKDSIRTNRPYTARHVPWYYTDLAILPPDEQHYYKTANSSASGKKRLVR